MVRFQPTTHQISSAIVLLVLASAVMVARGQRSQAPPSIPPAAIAPSLYGDASAAIGFIENTGGGGKMKHHIHVTSAIAQRGHRMLHALLVVNAGGGPFRQKD